MAPSSAHQRPFLFLSGIPGSGKTTLARRFAADLEMPLIDKDDILERLFESRGVGDAIWRGALSRESDSMLESAARASDGAVLVSFWRLPGMPPDSGTPMDWLASLNGSMVNVHCSCDPELAARRLLERKRHPGHLDGERSLPSIVAGFRELALLPLPEIWPRVVVDTSKEPDVAKLLGEVRVAFDRKS
jgi:hypothetical protein